VNPLGGGATQAGQPQSVAVQADDGVEVDRAPLLVFGHLGERHPDQPPQRLLGQAGELGQCAIDINGGSRPQSSGEGVPEDLGTGLVATRAQRLAQSRIVLSMALPAAQPPAMRAGSTLPIGVAGEHQQPLGLAGVDPAKGGGGEGHKQSRMGADRLGDALATAQPSGQELKAVGLVGRRAGRADRGPPVATRLEQGRIRLPLGRVHGPNLT
jgi:hypothetical protein